METIRKSLSRRSIGRGHFIVSINVSGLDYEKITTNTLAIDAAFDGCYNYEDNTGRYFGSQEDAQDELISEVMRANNIEL